MAAPIDPNSTGPLAGGMGGAEKAGKPGAGGADFKKALSDYLEDVNELQQ